MEIQKICRICMEVSSNLINIYKTMVLDDVVANLMIECADIEVYTGDGCPESVCTHCLAALENAYSLQKQIKRSDHILKDLADEKSDTLHQPIMEIKLDECVIKEECPNSPIEEPTIVETKTVIPKSELDDDEHNNTLPRWMLPKFTPEKVEFYCCMCTDTFDTRQLRQQHATKIHGIDPSKVVSIKGKSMHACTVCREVAFTTAAALDSHMRSKMKTVCAECGRSFPRKTIYKHLKRHEQAKKKMQQPVKSKEFLQCQYCERYFAPDRLPYHVARHINGQDYECAHCGKTFKLKRYLFLHCRRHFPSLMSNTKNYVCCHCDKAFENQQKLNSHSVVHTNERPFGCDYCELAFKTSTDLRRHRWLKHIDSPYTCQRCKKPFDRPITLFRHIAICKG